MKPPRRLAPAVMWLLMALHAGLLLDGSRRNFVVVDEAGHVPAGIAHWRTGSFRAYRVNPPLVRMLATLPVIAARPADDFRQLASADDRPEWNLGLDFMKANWSRYVYLVQLARLPGILWSLLGAWLIGRWSRELYGDVAGCLATALWCFDPTVLAFAQVVTPDVPATVAGLAATYAFRGYLKAPSWPRAALAGLLLGVAELTKYTLLALYGIWPLMCLIYRGKGARDGSAGQDEKAGSIQLLLTLMLSLVVINSGYGFRGTCRPLGEYSFSSRLLGGGEASSALANDSAPRNRFRGGWLGHIPIPVPQDYLLGIDIQQRDFEGGLPSYLAGRWRHRGWWYYYLYALAVKVPIGTLALIFLGLLSWRRPTAAPAAEELTLLLPVVVILGLVSSQTGFSHHMRYVLPIMPFLAIIASKSAVYLRRESRVKAALVCLLVGWSIAGSLSVHPHSMSYFNEAAGGSVNGHSHLVDSNIDWGQDLLFLKAWLRDHPEAEPLGLAYYQFVDPRVVGIDFRLPPPGPNGLFRDDPKYQAHFGPRPGYYAVSVNHLWGARFVAPDGQGGFRHATRGDYEYFRLFRPIARAGFSIYIYRITPAEADIVRRRLGLPPLGSEAD